MRKKSLGYVHALEVRSKLLRSKRANTTRRVCWKNSKLRIWVVHKFSVLRVFGGAKRSRRVVLQNRICGSNGCCGLISRRQTSSLSRRSTFSRRVLSSDRRNLVADQNNLKSKKLLWIELIYCCFDFVIDRNGKSLGSEDASRAERLDQRRLTWRQSWSDRGSQHASAVQERSCAINISRSWWRTERRLC